MWPWTRSRSEKTTSPRIVHPWSRKPLSVACSFFMSAPVYQRLETAGSAPARWRSGCAARRPRRAGGSRRAPERRRRRSAAAAVSVDRRPPPRRRRLEAPLELAHAPPSRTQRSANVVCLAASPRLTSARAGRTREACRRRPPPAPPTAAGAGGARWPPSSGPCRPVRRSAPATARARCAGGGSRRLLDRREVLALQVLDQGEGELVDVGGELAHDRRDPREAGELGRAPAGARR